MCMLTLLHYKKLYINRYILLLMAKDKVHTHEETGVTHAHEGGNKPHDHNEAEYEIAEKTGCICVDSRLLDCPEHGNKN